MSVLLITRPPQYTDPWFAEIEQVWDELEAANMDLDTRLTTLENTVGNDVVLSISKSGDPQLTGDITLTENGSIVITQVGNNIEIGGGGYTDHGALTGLGDDDHTQYLLASGTRSLAGNWSINNYELQNIRIENVIADPAAGNQGRLVFNTTDLTLRVDDGSAFVNIGVTDHGLLAGLGDDDHLQYLLVDGTRDCTGDFTVQGKYKGPANNSLILESQEDDVPTVVAHILDTATLLTDPAAKLLSIRNQGVEKFYVDKDGNIAIAQLSSVGSAFALIDTDNNSTTEVFSVRTDSPSSGSATELFSVEESGDAWLLGSLKVGGISSPAYALDVTGTGSITGDVLFGGQLVSNSNLILKLDADNDEAAVLEVRDGSSATVFSVNEAGEAAILSKLRVGGLTAATNAFEVDGDSDFNGLVTLAGGTPRIRSAANLEFQVDYDNDSTAAFTWYSGTDATVMTLDESGNLSISGTFSGGSSPFKFLSKAIANDGVKATGSITIINNSFDGGDSVTITDPSLTPYIFVAGVDFAIGVDADTTAANLRAAINLAAIGLTAQNVLNAVNLEADDPGTLGNSFALSESDGATDNFTLSGANLTGGTDVAVTAYELDTQYNLTVPSSNLFVLKNQGVSKFVIDKDGIITVGGGLTSATSVNAYIDNDANSSSEAFTVYHDVTTPTGGKELLQVRENGEVEIYGGPLIGGSSPFVIKSKEANGASAIGLQLQTQNALTTNGSKILKLINGTTEVLNLRRGTNLRGETGHQLVEYFDEAGTRTRQEAHYSDGGTLEIQDFIPAGRHIFWHSNDFTQSPLGETVFIDSYVDATSCALEQWVQSLDGSGGYAGYAAVNMYGDTTGGLLQLQVDGVGASNDISFDFWSTNQSAVGLTDARAIFNLAGAKLAIGSDGTLSSAIGIFKSNVADGVGATTFDLRSINAISAGSTALLRVRNQSSIKFEVGPTGVGSFQNILYVNAGDLGNNSGVIIGNGTLSAQGVNANVAAAGFAHLYASQVGVLKNVFKLGVDGTAYISPQQLVPNGTKVFRVYNNTGGTTLLSVDGNGDLEISGMLIGGSTPFKFKSKEANGASAVAYELDTNNSLSTTGAKLLSIKNATVEKFAIDKDGNIVVGGGSFCVVVEPSAGSTGIQAAVNTVAAAGGGMVQLKAGTYAIAASIVSPSVFNNVVIQGVGDSTVLDCTGMVGNAPLYFRRADSTKKNLNTVTVGDTSIYTTTAADAGVFLAGERLMVEGTDADGLKDRFWTRVKTSGNTGTGEVQIEGIVPKTLTTGTYTLRAASLKNGTNLTIRNMKISNTATQCAIEVQGMEAVLIENITHPVNYLALGGSLYSTYDVTVRNCIALGNNTTVTQGQRWYEVGRGVSENNRIENMVSSGITLTDCQDIIVRKNYLKGFSSTFAAGIDVVTTHCQRLILADNYIESANNNGILALGKDNQVLNNHLVNCAIRTVEPAIMIPSASLRCLVQGNTIIHAKWGMGIYGTESKVIGNSVRDVYAGGTTPYGIVVSTGTKIVIQDNILNGISSYGLLAYASDSVYSGNIIDTTGNAGIRSTSCARLIMSQNQIRNSTGAGIIIDNSVTDSLIVMNHTNGAGVTEGTGTGNDFIGNK